MKPAFLLPHDLSCPVVLAPLPALPAPVQAGLVRCAGRGIQGEESCGFQATLGYTCYFFRASGHIKSGTCQMMLNCCGSMSSTARRRRFDVSLNGTRVWSMA